MRKTLFILLALFLFSSCSTRQEKMLEVSVGCSENELVYVDSSGYHFCATPTKHCSFLCRNLFYNISTTWGADGDVAKIGKETLKCFNQCVERENKKLNNG